MAGTNGKSGIGGDRFDEVVADMNNSYTATYGLAILIAREHAPDTAILLDRELERYRRLVAELRGIHHGPKKQ
ncbi:MAG: hypothetical protein ACYTKD_31860 [Planctomycetota bacterium]|jgi:hypothetical protein